MYSDLHLIIKTFFTSVILPYTQRTQTLHGETGALNTSSIPPRSAKSFGVPKSISNERLRPQPAPPRRFLQQNFVLNFVNLCECLTRELNCRDLCAQRLARGLFSESSATSLVTLSSSGKFGDDASASFSSTSTTGCSQSMSLR